MANISEAVGQATFHTSDSALIDELDEICAHYYYSTDFDNRLPTENGHLSCSFIANGRWAYTTNIENFFEWTGQADKYEGLIIDFEFTDHEPGMQIAYQAHATIQCKDGKTVVLAYEETPYDYTAEGLSEFLDDHNPDGYPFDTTSLFGLEQLRSLVEDDDPDEDYVITDTADNLGLDKDELINIFKENTDEEILEKQLLDPYVDIIY